jgi:peptidoglycan/xylan/chitin deacetylase (PgdA/CDA1 family)
MPTRLKTTARQRAKLLAKKAIFEGAYRTGATRMLGAKYRGCGSVFMFHEITEYADDRLGLGCSVASFERTLRHISNAGFDFVDLAEAKRRLTDPSAKPFVALTFDDGYRDNIDLALPILEKFHAPATIFVPTEMATGEIHAWWLAICELVSLNALIDVPPMNETFLCETLEEKRNTYWRIIAWIWEDFNRHFDLADTFARHGIDMASLVRRHAMDAGEVRAADQHDLLSIQAHTHSHRALVTLRDDEVLQEMTSNKLWLENLLQRDVQHFAYPYGRPAIEGAREAQLARKAGFDIALTTDPGSLHPVHADDENLHLWPRENGEFSASVGAGVSWSLNGTWPAVKTRFGQAAVNINHRSPEAAE